MKGKIGLRGQVFSGELVLALLVFFTALSIVLLAWNNIQRDFFSRENARFMEESAVNAAELLLRTSGSPDNWSLNDVRLVGLANESRILSKRKVLDFLELMDAENSTVCSDGANYECNRHLIGLGAYDFSINFTDVQGNALFINDTILYAGLAPNDSSNHLTVARAAIFQDDIVRVYLTVWK
jgi:hypothetical protein